MPDYITTNARNNNYKWSNSDESYTMIRNDEASRSYSIDPEQDATGNGCQKSTKFPSTYFIVHTFAQYLFDSIQCAFMCGGASIVLTFM